MLIGLLGWYASELPDIARQADFERRTSITVLAADGTQLAHYGQLKGNSVHVDELPAHLVNAVIAIEDRRFYQHSGLDPYGLARAITVNIREGRVVQGGSTITQQLAKNLFLSHERTLKRKIQEAMLALWLEHELTKDEILSAYLNRVYFGSGTYGVDAAARLYFKKPATQVNLREATVLAGLLKAPSRYSPLSNPSLSKARANVVLRAMHDAGYISEKTTRNVLDIPPMPRSKPTAKNAARYFTDWVVDGLDELIGTPDKDLIIETTLDPAIQNEVEKALTQNLRSHGRNRNIGQGAVLVMRNDGAMLGLIGGRNYRESQFNRAIQAKRQPGSAFKPFVYLTALENGWRPNSTIMDAPIEKGRYHPDNFKDEYYGEVPLTEALMLSLNTATVRLMDAVGPEKVAETAHKLGVISQVNPYLSSALGTSSVSLLEMTTAYSVISNGGLRTLPYAITRIRDVEGRQYYERPDITRARRVLDQETARTMQAMLSQVIEHGTGRRAALPFEAAGKTGTSQDFRDAWFIGFSGDVVAGVWVGNDDNTPMKAVTGGSIPAQIWKEVMLFASERRRAGSGPLELERSFNALLEKLLGGERASAAQTQAAEEQIYWNSQRFNN